jgi:hypothetical protein
LAARLEVNLPSHSVAPVPELVGQRGMGRMPSELGSGFGGVGALVEQEDFGEVVAQAVPGLIVGAGDRSRRAGCDCCRRRTSSRPDHGEAA